MNMKKLILFILISTGGLGTAWSASVSGSIHGLDIKSCTMEKKKCFKLVSDEALMSQFLPLYTFKKFELNIFENKVEKSIHGSFGYMDLANRQIVVRKENSEAEFTINMDTLLEKDFSL